jgi:hypothetical protein
MPKGSSKSTAAIQRLLEERRQYEAWLARITAAGDATPAAVRTRVRADYEARLIQVTDELKVHAEAARQMVLQRKELRAELQKKEAHAAEQLSETELRHAVGEYDEAQWTQVHKDALAELVTVREELQSVEGDIAQLEELTTLVQQRRAAAPPPPPAPPAAEKPLPRVGPPPKPQPKVEERKPELKGEPRFEKKTPVDELAFLKSVTEDEKGGAPSPRRASGSQYQPVIPGDPPRAAFPAASAPAAESAEEPEAEPERTLKCKECGTMNLPTEWYCESCGAELAAL